MAWEGLKEGGVSNTCNHMYYIEVSVFMGVFSLKKTHFHKGKFFSPSSVHVEQSVLSCGRAGGRGRVLREGGARAVSVRVYISTFAHNRGAPSHVELTFT